MITSQNLQEIAVNIIFNYYEGLYAKDYIIENFNLAVDLMVENASNKISGAKSISENGISITYSDSMIDRFALTNDVLALLPKKRNFKAW